MPTHIDSAGVEQLVRYYFELGYRRKEIIGFLLFVHHNSVSASTLQRILRRLNLRRNRCQSQVRIIVSEIRKLHSLGYINNGYRSMWKILNTQCGVRATQDTVRKILKEIDGEGVRLRKIHRLRRREYTNLGPNHIIHIDGYDKLLPYGFPIHGAIDGFSRKILWLRVLPSNKNSRYIAKLYVEYLIQLKRTPKVIRSDAGTENFLAKDIHTFLRCMHCDTLSGQQSFSIGRSTANQRIESLWSCLMRNFTQYWRNLFKDLIDANIFNNTSRMHLNCIRFCFFNLIQNHLDRYRIYWNTHRIRAQSRRNAPTGIPDVLFNQSMLFGGSDQSLVLPCTLRYLFTISNEICQTVPYRGCEDAFLQILGEITEMNPYTIPYACSTDEAVTLFKLLIESM